MSEHKIIRIRPRRLFTALFLVFALFAGLVFGSGAEIKAHLQQLASVTDDG